MQKTYDPFFHKAKAFRIKQKREIAVLVIEGSIDAISRGPYCKLLRKLIDTGYKKIIIDINETFIGDQIDSFFLDQKIPYCQNAQVAFLAGDHSHIVKTYYKGILHGLPLRIRMADTMYKCVKLLT